MTDDTPADTTATNRSEIVFAFDAVDANPNGNPLSGANRPRIDPVTNEAIVTDVRLKRYIRDQLEDDGHGVYITSSRDPGDGAKTRETMLKDAIGVTDAEDLSDDPFSGFLDNAADARYFGATLSIDTDDQGILDAIDERDDFPDHLTGPVQFSPGKTLHPVEENESYNSLTSVIGTGEGKEQGGFDLDDHRIKYGFVGFHGIVDANGAEETHLSEQDVRRLDTLLWRSLKNQTVSRSKKGQEPRLYLRVEYDDSEFHVGGLTHDLDVRGAEEDGDELDPRAFRTIRDVVVETETLLDRLADVVERIETVHVVSDGVVEYDVGEWGGGEPVGADGFVTALREAVGQDRVRRIDVYDEYEATTAE